MRLSVLVPVYNEEAFVGTVLERVLRVQLPEGLEREIIVVDDCSTDRSADIVQELVAQYPDTVQLIRSEVNGGKGAAIHRAIAAATGDFSIVQDSDLEYEPEEYPKLLRPLLDGRADAVFGSRFLSSPERRVLYFWHSLANQFLTLACNIVSDLNLTDMETCYKVVRTSLLQNIPLRNKRFGFEPEITIKLARRKARIYEVPISYNGRTYEEGKKIGLKDAFEALYTIVRYAYTSDLYTDHGQRILHVFSQAPHFNRWMADTIRPYLGSQVLEIGAGMGNLTRELSPKRKRYIATDIDQQHLTRLKHELAHYPNLEIRVCNLESKDDFACFHDQVESVVCLNVLEHISDDMQGLRNIYGALKPGGRALILVPEGPQLYGSLDHVLGHFRRYSRAELQGKLQQVGFRVEDILEFNRAARPGWYVTGKVFKRDVISPASLKLFDRMVWLWRRVDRMLPWPSTSIIGVAVKE
jgi:glycosyltransferase involved in cell wall biosynthesis